MAVSGEEYSGLTKSLLDGYSVRQLSRYLSKALQRPPSKVGGRVRTNRSTRRRNTIPILAWRPQSMSLDQNDISETTEISKQGEAHHVKSKLVEQILRRSWSLSLDGEVHQVGYLEMKLKQWQLSFLFDLYEDSRPMYEKWIDSPLLQRSSELRPDRADNVLRVVARKHDADEIAERIQQRFGEFESLELDLSALAPVDSHQQRSWSSNVSDIDALEPLQRRLFCIFERKDDKTLIIHAPFKATLWHARRAYLALFDMPSPCSVESMTMAADDIENVHSLPATIKTGVESSNQTSQYRRLASPTAVAVHGSSSDDSTNLSNLMVGNEHIESIDIQALANRLLAIPPTKPLTLSTSPMNRPFWEPGGTLQSEPWEVQFCRILHRGTHSGAESRITTPSSIRNKGITANQDDDLRRSTIQTQIPGIASLLEHCVPTSDTIKSPIIVAHFLPNPFTLHGLSPLTKLPRIRLTYSLSMANERSEVSTAHLYGIQAVFDQQELRVHLPHEATDLRFVRQATLRGLKGLASGDKEVRKFTAKLQNSLNRKYSFLDGEPVVRFRLPSSPYQNLTEPWARDLRDNDLGVEYLFERFEQVQSLDLKLSENGESSENMDPVLQQILGKRTFDMSLRYQEIEAGNVGGRRTELRLMSSERSAPLTEDHHPATSEVRDSEEGNPADMAEKHFKLVDTSLRLASAITELNAGRRSQA